MKNHTFAISDSTRHGYTIVELLVVTVIAVLLLTIAVPAIQSAVYSSNRSLAANALEAASLMGRDVAINTGQDGAVVFVYDPQVQRINIIPAVKVGTVREPTTAPTSPPGGLGGPAAVAFGVLPYFDRDVFVPAPIGEVLSIPAGWMISGYATPGMLLDQDSAGDDAATWYNSENYGGLNFSATNLDDPKLQAHWVFPETGFFARDSQGVGGNDDGAVDFDLDYATTTYTARQSFMIRFDARTGVVSRDTRSAIFVDPRNSNERDPDNRLDPTLRVDLADDLQVWAQRVLSSPDLDGDGVGYATEDGDLRLQLIGSASNDTILVKPVSRLALYDINELAQGIGLRGVNRVTNTLYLPVDETMVGNGEWEIQFDPALIPDGLTEEDVVERITQWIDGDTNFDGEVFFNPDDTPTDEPESRLYLVESYSGELKEILR